MAQRNPNAPGFTADDARPVTDFLGITAAKEGPWGTDAYNPNAIDMTGRIRQAQGFDPAAYQANLGQQNAFANVLQRASNGIGPSVAQSQFQQHAQQAQNMARGLFNQNRGAGGALNAYYAAQGIGNMAQDAAAQAAQLRAQEQLGARGQYGQMLQGIGQSNLQYGGMQNQMNLANAEQYNQMLANVQAQANALRGQQNADISQMEGLRQKANYELRDWGAQQLAQGLAGGASTAVNKGIMLSML